MRKADFNENINLADEARTPENYKIAIEQAKECKTKAEREKVLKNYGAQHTEVPSLYIFDPLYHPLTQNIWDSMHDLLEGAAQLILNATFAYVVENKMLSVEEINTRISKFSYGSVNSKNKPNAMQAWLLMRSLTFLINDKLYEQHSEEIKNIQELVSLHISLIQQVFSTSLTKGKSALI